jgi:hypothetical protein
MLSAPVETVDSSSTTIDYAINEIKDLVQTE